MILQLSDFITLAQGLTDTVDQVAIARIYVRWLKSDEEPSVFLQAYIPKAEYVAVAEICGTENSAAADRATKWLSQQNIAVLDTINGPYVDAAGGEKLFAFLQNAIAVHPVYGAFCNELAVATSPASYYRLITFLKRNIIRTRWHPLQPEYTEYWMLSLEELTASLRRWIALENADKPVNDNGYMSVSNAAKQMQLSVTKLLAWLHEHPNCYTYQRGQYLVKSDWVEQTTAIWSQAVRIEDVAATVVEYLPGGKREECKAAAVKWAYENPFSWQLTPDDYPQISRGIYVSDDNKESSRLALSEYVGTLPAWPLSILKECSGYPTSRLKEFAQNNIIDGVLQDNGEYLISTNERNRILNIASQFVPLDVVIVDAIGSMNSLFNLRFSEHRAAFMRFGTNNNWWGLLIISGERYPINSGLFHALVSTEDVEELQSKSRSWLLGYLQDDRTQFSLLLEHYSSQYPKTVATMRRYYQKAEITKAIVDMADLLLHLLPKKELTDVSAKQLDDIATIFSDSATLVSCTELADFLFNANITKKQYEFEGTGIKKETSAYSVQDFAVMVAAIVNEQIIQELNLVQKAVNDPKCAALWLYVAVHVFAAWRDTDYSRVNAPILRYDPATTLKMINDGQYSKNDAIYVANYFIADCKFRWLHPNKTKEVSSGITSLYFMCPEACKDAFGLILSIACAHYNLNGNSAAFIEKVCDKRTIIKFFGPIFFAACGSKSFSGRRANKALMQAIEYESRETGGANPLVAYSLATRMRSHKVTYGQLSQTTDIYLGDVNFAGLSPEYVLFQMFQRGVCSFSVDIMIKQCYGEQYSQLSVAAQTEAIRSVGVHVSHLDIALRSTQAALDAAIDTVRSLAMDKQKMTVALRRIAAGRAHGKNMDTQCIVKATGQDCKCPDRKHCLGCKYEIASKALLLNYLLAYRKCQQDDVSNIEKQKNKWLAGNVILPKIQEIAAHLPSNTDMEEMRLYIDLIEEVERNGAASNNTA